MRRGRKKKREQSCGLHQSATDSLLMVTGTVNFCTGSKREPRGRGARWQNHKNKNGCGIKHEEKLDWIFVLHTLLLGAVRWESFSSHLRWRHSASFGGPGYPLSMNWTGPVGWHRLGHRLRRAPRQSLTPARVHSFHSRWLSTAGCRPFPLGRPRRRLASASQTH